MDDEEVPYLYACKVGNHTINSLPLHFVLELMQNNETSQKKRKKKSVNGMKSSENERSNTGAQPSAENENPRV